MPQSRRCGPRATGTTCPTRARRHAAPDRVAEPERVPSWEELAEGYEDTLLLQALVVMFREYAWHVRHATLRQVAAFACGALLAYLALFAVAVWAAI